MGKKITITYSVTYNFRGALLKDYLEWLDDDKDTEKMRKWFAIDRFVGHDNLDPKAKLKVVETK